RVTLIVEPETCNSGGSWTRGCTRRRDGFWLRPRPLRLRSERVCTPKMSGLGQSARGGLRLPRLLFVTRMERCNSYMGVGALGKIFVTFQANGNPDLGLRRAGSGNRRRAVRANNAQDVSLAAHRHTLAERD